jgi:hypothetical protein
MKRGDKVIDNQVFQVWQGMDLWYWQYKGPRNGRRTLSLSLGKGATTEADCITEIKEKVADHNRIHASMSW